MKKRSALQSVRKGVAYPASHSSLYVGFRSWSMNLPVVEARGLSEMSTPSRPNCASRWKMRRGARLRPEDFWSML